MQREAVDFSNESKIDQTLVLKVETVEDKKFKYTVPYKAMQSLL